MGIPTVLIVASTFEGLFRAAAKAFAMPDLPYLVTPYPVAPDAELADHIAKRVDEVQEALIRAITRG